MANPAIEVEPARAERVTAAKDLAELRLLQRQMLKLALAATTQIELLQPLAALIHRYAKPLALSYFSRNDRGELTDAISLQFGARGSRSELLVKQLAASCQAASRSGELVIRQQAASTHVIIATPIVLRGSDPEALGVVFANEESQRHLIMLVQMVASHIMLWHVMASGRDSEIDARDAAALIEMLEQITGADDLRHACHRLAGGLQAYLQCQRVAIGLRRAGTGRCRIAAISGVAQIDNRSQTTHVIEAALDESIVRDDVTTWPPTDDEQRHGELAHKKLCSHEDMKSVVSTPLRDHNGTAIGALVVFAESLESLAAVSRFVRAAERSFATSLGAVQRLEGGRWARFGRAAGRLWRSWKSTIALVAVLLFFAVMAVPMPYRIRCDCQIEPTTRRFVAAPFDGTLEKSFVKAGDIVSAGDVLARIDGREIRWKRASVAADRGQAVKRRDAAQAAHRFADAQIARLEMERLDLELRLLDYRTRNLEIKSPVSGVVVSGDLERAEGAPLTIGQTLFEIAPLEMMIVEVAVPDDEISHVRKGQAIDVWLDAYLDETWRATVTKVHPRSEIRHDSNVFIAEARLDNTDGRLRPGMKGFSKVVTTRRALGWILFHKPWEHLTKKLHW